MNIALPEYDESAYGGGWSFIYNFRKALSHHITPYEEAEVFFIPSASMVSREAVQKARDDGKKIVLRCDNIIRNSRNRNSGMTRMKDFADWSDVVIFQSQFAKDLLDPYLQTKNSKIILNSCDQDVFKPLAQRQPGGPKRYLYVRSSTDETKNWEMARVAFQNVEGPKILTIVGKGFDGLMEYNYDFYQDEIVKFIGEVKDRGTMATIYQNNEYLLYSYFNDACSNTAIEALNCGLTIANCYGMAETGGTPEILDKFREFGYKWFSLDRMGAEYMEAMK